MFQRWEVPTLFFTRIHASTLNQSDKYNNDWEITNQKDQLWNDREQARKASPPEPLSFCTTLDGSWPNDGGASCSFSSASTLNDTNYTSSSYLFSSSASTLNDTDHTHSNIPPQITLNRQTSSGFEISGIHASIETLVDNGEINAEHNIPSNNDDDDMTLVGDDELDVNANTCLGFTKQQTPVIADHTSLLTNMLLHCPPASCSLPPSTNQSPSSCHSPLVLDNDVLSSSLKQQVWWENKMSGGPSVLIKQQDINNSSGDVMPMDPLDTFTGVW
ncbi:hypothetical protein BC941DRAFT_509438 [Chlamydoabsidia padenii]|nr:hypothetical protein BC941DRAFT_509438 [Chlamydoabsidia padenii]